MKRKKLDAIVIGAGPSGLSIGYHLKKHGLECLILERKKIGESWQSHRWNTFRLNSPNRLNELPDAHHNLKDPEAFSSAQDYVVAMRSYVSKFQLPVLEDHLVLSVQKKIESGVFRVSVLHQNQAYEYYSHQVIIASGQQSEIKIPAISKEFPAGIKQIHAGEYRSVKDLPDGNVLIVGGAQSGCQIADDLTSSPKEVFLSTSMVGRVPRRFRGRDIHDWLLDMGFFNTKRNEVTEPSQLRMRAPQLTGVGQMVRTISLQSLNKKGISLCGRLSRVAGDVIFFERDLKQNIQFADEFSLKIKDLINGFVTKHKLITPEAEIDSEDTPWINTGRFEEKQAINLTSENIKTIIWATGFGYDLSYIHHPVIDDNGFPIQSDGVADLEGLYFLGFPWVRNFKSTLLCGIREDAAFVAGKVYEFANRKVKV